MRRLLIALCLLATAVSRVSADPLPVPITADPREVAERRIVDGHIVDIIPIPRQLLGLVPKSVEIVSIDGQSPIFVAFDPNQGLGNFPGVVSITVAPGSTNLVINNSDPTHPTIDLGSAIILPGGTAIQLTNGAISTIQSTSTTIGFNLTMPGTTTAPADVLVINPTLTPTGFLLRAKVGGADRLTIDSGGNLVTIGNMTAVNGTLSGTLSLTATSPVISSSAINTVQFNSSATTPNDAWTFGPVSSGSGNTVKIQTPPGSGFALVTPSKNAIQLSNTSPGPIVDANNGILTLQIDTSGLADTLVVNNNTSGTLNTNLLNVQANGTTKFVVDKNGNATASGNGAVLGNLAVTGTSTLSGSTVTLGTSAQGVTISPQAAATPLIVAANASNAQGSGTAFTASSLPTPTAGSTPGGVVEIDEPGSSTALQTAALTILNPSSTANSTITVQPPSTTGTDILHLDTTGPCASNSQILFMLLGNGTTAAKIACNGNTTVQGTMTINGLTTISGNNNVLIAGTTAGKGQLLAGNCSAIGTGAGHVCVGSAGHMYQTTGSQGLGTTLTLSSGVATWTPSVKWIGTTHPICTATYSTNAANATAADALHLSYTGSMTSWTAVKVTAVTSTGTTDTSNSQGVDVTCPASDNS